MRVDGFGFGLDSVDNMYYASCGGASALPGVISPNDSVDYVSKLRWWQILLISLGALLVIVLAIRVGRRLQGKNRRHSIVEGMRPNHGPNQYALLHNEGLDRIRGSDTDLMEAHISTARSSCSDHSDPKCTSGSSETEMLPPGGDERLGTDDETLKKISSLLNSPI
eukprot:FR743443.1.p1 GENE.FR743443.1~~FR743443.1.p1  ORF type:complete len:183 (+),score=10.10 FR743443.1:54-551(+)